jgi:hypothetical protein
MASPRRINSLRGRIPAHRQSNTGNRYPVSLMRAIPVPIRSERRSVEGAHWKPPYAALLDPAENFAVPVESERLQNDLASLKRID